ncbi:MAG TPA: hypothetical protein VM577_20130 [Anaerovoracaceae bacterium]|nr:hypothetical protein [Anaerovoracaceae bacterium]
MIKEKTSYTDDLPVNIRIVEIEEYPLHFHQDIEFVYVLRGDISLKCGYFTYHITEGTGMNFRDFLCFARVEFSEMILARYQ